MLAKQNNKKFFAVSATLLLGLAFAGCLEGVFAPSPTQEPGPSPQLEPTPSPEIALPSPSPSPTLSPSPEELPPAPPEA